MLLWKWKIWQFIVVAPGWATPLIWAKLSFLRNFHTLVLLPHPPLYGPALDFLLVFDSFDPPSTPAYMEIVVGFCPKSILFITWSHPQRPSIYGNLLILHAFHHHPPPPLICISHSNNHHPAPRLFGKFITLSSSSSCSPALHIWHLLKICWCCWRWIFLKMLLQKYLPIHHQPPPSTQFAIGLGSKSAKTIYLVVGHNLEMVNKDLMMSSTSKHHKHLLHLFGQTIIL